MNQRRFTQERLNQLTRLRRACNEWRLRTLIREKEIWGKEFYDPGKDSRIFVTRTEDTKCIEDLRRVLVYLGQHGVRKNRLLKKLSSEVNAYLTRVSAENAKEEALGIAGLVVYLSMKKEEKLEPPEKEVLELAGCQSLAGFGRKWFPGLVDWLSGK